MFFKDFRLNILCVIFVRKLNIRGTHINKKILREEKLNLILFIVMYGDQLISMVLGGS